MCCINPILGCRARDREKSRGCLRPQGCSASSRATGRGPGRKAGLVEAVSAAPPARAAAGRSWWFAADHGFLAAKPAGTSSSRCRAQRRSRPQGPDVDPIGAAAQVGAARQPGPAEALEGSQRAGLVAITNAGGDGGMVAISARAPS